MHTHTSYLDTKKLRALFLEYFQRANHQVVASSSLIPQNDPTLLFTNAGMVQFKDVFLAKESRPFKRATSSQRCVRAGGKHNDLERVGYTARHHTFFEMLGNFSFGDYFKREAIQFAWDFLTKVLKLPAEKLWVTVYKDDDEAADIWLKELKIDMNRFTRCGDESNFWSMGPTGPCGPCTEIFYDHGENIAGGPPGSPEEDGDRYVEIWNLVFMQYDRGADGTLTPLPKPSVDTGMGLERIAAVMQGVSNNYDIDLFRNLIQSIATLANVKNLADFSLRVIADHIRSCAFLIADGVTPSNEGRGYVLRRIIRRALRHGHKLGLTQPFFYQLIDPLSREMGEAYPELIDKKTFIEKTLLQEEEQFSVTLATGLKLFDQVAEETTGKVISGDVIFKLYDTYGFPADLTADIARERGLSLDHVTFDQLMQAQKTRSRLASKFGGEYQVGANIDNPTMFVGYEDLHKTHPASILALYHHEQPTEALSINQRGAVILDTTPFYAESGGQVGDQGILTTPDEQIIFKVEDTRKQGKVFVHYGQLEKGTLKINTKLIPRVDIPRRKAAVLNHTATHLLHMVLREVLGKHVIQKGSLVAPDRLRFDFSHSSALTASELKTIERRVNEEIRSNHEASVHVTSPEEAIKQGALALFEEKYGEEVRVVQFGESVELCGGTHAHYTGDIGLFKIIGESSVASGIRRLFAVTGEAALDWIDSQEQELKSKLEQIEQDSYQLEKQLAQLKQKLSGSQAEELISQVKMINGIKLLTASLENIDIKNLRQTMDQLKDKLGSGVIVLAAVNGERISLIAGVTKDLINKIKAGELVNTVAKLVGGKGGGRADLAEAGGSQPENLAEALKSVELCIKDRIPL